MAYIKSIQVGKIVLLDSQDDTAKKCLSGFNKNEFCDKIFVGIDGVVGDEIADTKHHGGKEKAIFANSFENYEIWMSFLGKNELPYGALGENLTISGLDEKTVCVGDIHKIGDTLLQVSQPRKPCFKISKRWQNKDFAKEIFKSKKTGWYYRVLQTGYINKNDTIQIIQKDKQHLSIYEINSAFYEPKNINKIFLENFFALSTITKNWHEDMRKRVNNIYDLSYMEL